MENNFFDTTFTNNTKIFLDFLIKNNDSKKGEFSTKYIKNELNFTMYDAIRIINHLKSKDFIIIKNINGKNAIFSLTEKGKEYKKIRQKTFINIILLSLISLATGFLLGLLTNLIR